jgi:putative oxidoreductase
MVKTTSRVRSFLLGPPAGRGTDLGLLALRLGFGLTMGLTHGRHLLEGFLADPSAYPDPLGLGPGVSMGLMVFAELVCALLVAAGLFTRLALVPLVLGMALAVFVRFAGEPFAERELAFLYLSVWTALLFTGPGRFSLDRWLFGRNAGER